MYLGQVGGPKKVPSEGGSGGPRGHSSTEQSDHSDEIKDAAGQPPTQSTNAQNRRASSIRCGEGYRRDQRGFGALGGLLVRGRHGQWRWA